AARFEAAERLLERFLERAADGHRFADRLHLRGQSRVGVGELFEGPAWELGDDVVDGRLEARRRLAGDVVLQFVEPVADGELGGDRGNGEAGRLGRQRARAGNARVHLDGDHVAGLRLDRKLDVAAARLDADLADDGDRRIAHALVFAVGERL